MKSYIRSMRHFLFAIATLTSYTASAQWVPISGFDEFDFKKCSFVNDTVGYAIADWFSEGLIWRVAKTTDGGDSWQVVMESDVVQNVFLDIFFRAYPYKGWQGN